MTQNKKPVNKRQQPVITSKKTSYQGRVLSVETYELDFGHDHLHEFELVKFDVETGVSALPLTDDAHVVLIRHYQLGSDKQLISIPSGGLHTGEDPDTRMQLELQEEAGFKAGKLTLMGRNHILPGYIGTVPGYLFLAEELEPSEKIGDEPYDIELLALPVDDAIKMIKSGEIIDGRTAYALLLYDKFYRNK